MGACGPAGEKGGLLLPSLGWRVQGMPAAARRAFVAPMRRGAGRRDTRARLGDSPSSGMHRGLSLAERSPHPKGQRPSGRAWRRRRRAQRRLRVPGGRPPCLRRGEVRDAPPLARSLPTQSSLPALPLSPSLANAAGVGQQSCEGPQKGRAASGGGHRERAGRHWRRRGPARPRGAALPPPAGARKGCACAPPRSS